MALLFYAIPLYSLWGPVSFYKLQTWQCFWQQVKDSLDIVCLKWNTLDNCQWVSSHSEQLYKEAQDTERKRDEGRGERERGEGTNRWINELSGEKGIVLSSSFCLLTPLPPIGQSSVCYKCSPPSPFASLLLRSSPNRNCSVALNM